MKNIEVILKCGKRFYVTCESVVINKPFGMALCSVEFKGATTGKPLFLDVNDVSAILECFTED